MRRVRCVLRDEPRLRRVTPQHYGMMLIVVRKTPDPEVRREAEPRRTHDILPALRQSHPARRAAAASGMICADNEVGTEPERTRAVGERLRDS